jgi:hypothetical protein
MTAELKRRAPAWHPEVQTEAPDLLHTQGDGDRAVPGQIAPNGYVDLAGGRWSRDARSPDRVVIGCTTGVILINSAQGVAAGQAVWYTHRAKDK